MRERHPRSPSPRRQRGAALLTAMIIVTIVVTLASSKVWQQWRAVQVEQAERARTQAAWILSGALDFARLILKEDLKSGRPTALTEPWATPLAEARLSTFLAADGSSNTDDGPEAFLSGKIGDAQARYNLSNLVTADGKIDAEEFATLERLCLAVGMDSAVAQRIAGGMRDATNPGTVPNANAPLLPQSVAQLSWLGLDAATIAVLETVVVLLPAPTPVNINTASREVLVGAIKGLALATAERILQIRQRTPFKTLQLFYDQVPTLMPLTAKLDVKSSFFEVRGKLRLADRVLVERSLVHRLPNGQIDVLLRERIASVDAPGA